MNLVDLLPEICPWLRNGGEESDIVVASRIRLARNLVGFPFPVRATESDRRSVWETVQRAAREIFPENEYLTADIPTLSSLEREYIQERQLISQKIVESEQFHAILINRQEQFCVVVNDDDHIKIHVTESGLCPQKIWGQLDKIDNQFNGKLDYVFHEKYGFLTSRATHAGTGMKITMLLHLPGLVATNEIDKVVRSMMKKNLTVRGLYGEQSLGDLFIVGNRVTLGKSEEELVARMIDLIPQIVGYERQARQFLLTNRREMIFDRCSRAVGVLQTARTISLVETLRHLSSLRLGVHMGLLGGLLGKPDMTVINSLLLYTQPAHLQKMQGEELSQADQDVARATYIRQHINQ
jgi:protein arginine kinase